jgi:hypothetical protein
LRAQHQIFRIPIFLDFDCKPALEKAKELGRYYKEDGRPEGQLHCLLASFKGQFHVKELETILDTSVGSIHLTVKGDLAKRGVSEVKS